MALDITPIVDAARSHAMASGRYEQVTLHEPRNAPGAGITWALWMDTIEPVPADSGLATTTARVTFVVRLYGSMLTEPTDAIDPTLTQATVDLMVAYSTDYDLSGTVRNIDLLGQTGTPLSSRAGYLKQDERLFRIYDIALPVIVNDVFTQSP